MSAVQLPLPIDLCDLERARTRVPYSQRLAALLAEDLDFHDQDSGYASHNFHSFPAKFPPQLPRKFIVGLTAPGDVVLDPMTGSGTTIVEALIAGRYGIGVDIDPLALAVSRVKSTPVSEAQVGQVGSDLLRRAAHASRHKRGELDELYRTRWDHETRRFIEYWFAAETRVELVALVREIEGIAEPDLRSFFQIALSAIIITKSGGVSLALDLAHTRPHRARIVADSAGNTASSQSLSHTALGRARVHTKRLRSALGEFGRRLQTNTKGLRALSLARTITSITAGDAQALPLRDASVDLIVTSPPYASNAIDYMRAHKFSLVWMGYPVAALGERRKRYIGGEAMAGTALEALPERTASVVEDITQLDKKKGRVLHRYYSEMTRSLREMLRVLKPGRAAVVVVGSSVMRGRDTETPSCLADIGEAIGFQVAGIGVRNLDRNRRMLPAASSPNPGSQIQQRIHQEYVVGFYKPEA
jgi:DNA modification methylase